MVATAVYSMTMVLQKDTAFPLCAAMFIIIIIIIIIIGPPAQSRGQDRHTKLWLQRQFTS